jgi:hypothetical protein
MNLTTITVAKGGLSLDVTLSDYGNGDADIGAGRWSLESVKLGEFDLTSLLDDSAVLDDIFEEAVEVVS